MLQLCDKNNKHIKELIRTGTNKQINKFICCNCEKCEKPCEAGCDGLAWLDDILETNKELN